MRSFIIISLPLVVTVGASRIIHIMHSRELIRRLERKGWVLRSVKGSHHIYTHPERPGHISVPHPQKELGVGLLQKLLKQAGLK